MTTFPHSWNSNWSPTVYSLALHGMLLFGVGMTAVAAPKFGVSEGEGGVEVQLIAAPARSRSTPVETPVVKKEMPSDASSDVAIRTVAPQKVAEVSGDGSSSVPGKDSITVSSSHGAETSASPNYLRNPAPVYPERARAMSQEGVVLLSVEVSREGKVKNLKLKSSSGFPLLDEAAIRSVRHWVFEAGSRAGITVASNVDVPIRFKLDRL